MDMQEKYDEFEEYVHNMENLARALVIRKENPMCSAIVNIGVNPYNNCGQWLEIKYQDDKSFHINSFEEMRELWQAIKDISEKAKVLYDEHMMALSEPDCLEY